jgi:hypothetical protein
MIIQKSLEGHQVIAISQTAHAWVSGQLARQWGNECFPDAPVEPICYAAEQHDRGFLDWERQPTLNPKSGLPHTFEDIPLSLHVELRKRSILELKAVSLYAALVTSLYFARAVGKQRPIESHEDRQRIAEFLQEQKALQRNLLGSLRKDPYLRSACSDRAIEYNQKLLAAWDQLSVQLCRNPDSKFSVNDVPTASEEMNQPTSIQMLDAAIWKELDAEEVSQSEAFYDALGTLLSRWLLARSEYPEMEAIKLFAKVRAYVAQPERFL